MKHPDSWLAIIDPRGIAPDGYHIASGPEWRVLIDSLGCTENSDEYRCDKIKSTYGWSYTLGGTKICSNCASWNNEYRRKMACHTCKDTRVVPAPIVSHSNNGNNISGFSALPAGSRGFLGSFNFAGNIAHWWVYSQHEFDLYEGDYLSLSLSGFHWNPGRGGGYSVRCIKD